MKNGRSITSHGLFRAALMVPTVIALIFSIFTLTAPPDQARISKNVTLGVVNLDEGLTFPPLKVSNIMLGKLTEAMPFRVADFENVEAARAALDSGSITMVLAFPQDFSKQVAGEAPIELTFLNSQHLSMIESQIGMQAPQLLQAAFSAGIATFREALKAGQIPDGNLPVSLNIETLHPAKSAASLVAPFTLVYTTWLGALVGALMLFIASRAAGTPVVRGAFRTWVPIVSAGVAALATSLVVSLVTRDWTLFLPVLVTFWSLQLVIGWMMNGLFSTFGYSALIIVFPTAFYQTALSGAQIPKLAAPEWLLSIYGALPFEVVGRAFRDVIYRSEVVLPLEVMGITAAIGLGMIWFGAALTRKKAAPKL